LFEAREPFSPPVTSTT